MKFCGKITYVGSPEVSKSNSSGWLRVASGSAFFMGDGFFRCCFSTVALLRVWASMAAWSSDRLPIQTRVDIQEYSQHDALYIARDERRASGRHTGLCLLLWCAITDSPLLPHFKFYWIGAHIVAKSLYFSTQCWDRSLVPARSF